MTDLPAADEITGAAGELADRFIDALEQVTRLDANLDTFVTLPVMLALHVAPADPFGSGKPVLDLKKLGERILGLLRSGIDERFLIQALRDEITRSVDRFADTKHAMESREEDRRLIEEFLTDPLGIDRFRETAHLTRDESDESIRAGLQGLADRLAPPDADEAARAWGFANTWKRIREHYLADPDLRRWEDRRLAARRQHPR